jgi:hypothetical protein
LLDAYGRILAVKGGAHISLAARAGTGLEGAVYDAIVEANDKWISTSWMTDCPERLTQILNCGESYMARETTPSKRSSIGG